MSALDLPQEDAPAARRRLGAVALVYAYRALAGLLVAVPATLAVGSVTSSYPRGQAELFDPGAVMLFESVRLGRRGFTPATWNGGLVMGLAAVIGLFPLAMLIAALDRRGRLSAAFLAERAWKHLGTFAILFGLGAVSQVVAGLLVGLVGGKIVGALKLTGPADDVGGAIVIALALGVAAVIGVTRDLAYAAAVRGDHGFYVATSHAVRGMRRGGLRALGAWAWRAALGFAALVVAAVIAPPGAAAGAVVLGLVVHQLAVAASVYARASWLAVALRLVTVTAPESPGAADPGAGAGQAERDGSEGDGEHHGDGSGQPE